jgi:hypothetical protein
MPWTDGVPEELVKKLEAKNAVCIYRRDPDFWIDAPPPRETCGLTSADAWRAPMRGEAGGRAFRGREAAVTEASAGPLASV